MSTNVKTIQSNSVFLSGTQIGQVVDISDGSANHVYKINKKYVYKTFGTADDSIREQAGMELFKVLTNDNIPTLYEQVGKHIIEEYISDAVFATTAIKKAAISPEYVNVKIANFIAKNYWAYQTYLDANTKQKTYLSWENNLFHLVSEFRQNRSKVGKILGYETYKNLCAELIEVIALKNKFNLTILHRDIHLDNILVKEENNYKNLYLIDFEHSMEGPLELEFQNSLFWRDEKSLDVASIVTLLRDVYRIPYSLSIQKKVAIVYLVDQINRAIKDKQLWKIKELYKKKKTKNRGVIKQIVHEYTCHY